MKRLSKAGIIMLVLLAGAVSLNSKAAKTQANKVVVYYIHGNFRCANCMKIEAYSKEAVETGFAPEMKSGKVEWKVINYEEKGNAHYFTDYKLFTKSVIVSDVKKGKEKRFKNLPAVWQHLGDKAAFMAYVQTEVKDYLEGTK